MVSITISIGSKSYDISLSENLDLWHVFEFLKESGVLPDDFKCAYAKSQFESREISIYKPLSEENIYSGDIVFVKEA